MSARDDYPTDDAHSHAGTTFVRVTRASREQMCNEVDLLRVRVDAAESNYRVAMADRIALAGEVDRLRAAGAVPGEPS